MSGVDDPLLEDALARLAAGQPRALSRAVSLVENGEPRGMALLERVYASAPAPRVIGLEGSTARIATRSPRAAKCSATRGTSVLLPAPPTPVKPITQGCIKEVGRLSRVFPFAAKLLDSLMHTPPETALVPPQAGPQTGIPVYGGACHGNGRSP